ncbi:hypothetical protein Droror1_Dr00004597 [Drosera rotundifolia]
MENCCTQHSERSDYDDNSEIKLRPIELSDVDDFMVWATNEQVTHFCSFSTYTSKEQALDYIKNKAIPHPYYRAICLSSGKAIGAISVSSNTDEHKCRGEIGYVLGKKYWGKGIATRAVKLVGSCIFKEWPHLERLEGLVDVENVASQKVLEKAGFRREGVLRKYLMMKGRCRDMVMFSLLSGDDRE